MKGLGSKEEFLQFFYRRAAIFGVAGVTIYYTNLETTPVTNRSRLILFPSAWEAMLGDIAVKQVVSIRWPAICPDTSGSWLQFQPLSLYGSISVVAIEAVRTHAKICSSCLRQFVTPELVQLLPC